MKKLFFLTIAIFFSVVIKAQSFIVDNNSASSINVYPGKFYNICLTAPDCTMSAMTGIAGGGGTASVGYPSLCTNKNVMFGIEFVSGTIWGHFYWCGTDLYGQPVGDNIHTYDVVSTGGGNITHTVN